MIRPSGLRDLVFVYNCRNSSLAQAASLDTKPFSFPSHILWYLRTSAGERPYVVMRDARRIGYVRFRIDKQKKAIWSFAKDPSIGSVGRQITEEAARYAFDKLGLEEISAVVRKENTASRHLHQVLGFKSLNVNEGAEPDAIMLTLRKEDWIDRAY